jgi:hypothetical protein
MQKAFKHILKYYEIFFFLVLILYTILFNNHSFYYDEPYYLHNVDILNEYGLGSYFIKNMYGPAGPLHAVIFWLLQSITHNAVLQVRLVNIVFLAIIIFFARKTYKAVYDTKESNSRVFLGMMSIPMVYVCSGMALTEIPALMMLSFSLYLLFTATSSALNYKWFLSGLFLALSICGRQPYLVLLFPYLIWFWTKVSKQNRVLGTIIFGASILLIPVLLMIQWKGIAPSIGGDIANKEFINFQFLLLGLGYSFLVTILLDYRFFFKLYMKHYKYYLGAFFICFCVCYYFQIKQPLMMTIAGKLLSGKLYELYGVLIASILMIVGVYFFLSLIKQLMNSLNNPKKVFMLVSLLLMVLSCTKISHQFSSRYIFQAAIFFLLSVEQSKFDNKQVVLSILGAFIGLATLFSYYP